MQRADQLLTNNELSIDCCLFITSNCY